MRKCKVRLFLDSPWLNEEFLFHSWITIPKIADPSVVLVYGIVENYLGECRLVLMQNIKFIDKEEED